MNEQHQISTAENILHTDTSYMYDLTSMSMSMHLCFLMNRLNWEISLLP